jgi:class 3 adenylate cyclase
MPIPEQSAETQLPLLRDEAAIKRQLAAILCADVVDYSYHMQED